VLALDGGVAAPAPGLVAEALEPLHLLFYGSCGLLLG
jgi:hypothetical protein